MKIDSSEAVSGTTKSGREVSDIGVHFLGGLYGGADETTIQKISNEPLQYAANALQRSFISGLYAVGINDLKVVSLPFVSSYPQSFKKPFYQGAEWSSHPFALLSRPKFSTIRFYRYISRTIAAYKPLKRQLEQSSCDILFIYSAHLPFIITGYCLKKVMPQISVCVVVPDLPEFMGYGRLLSRFLVWNESLLIKRLIRNFDSFVFLTEATGEHLGVPADRRIVIEGIYDPSDDSLAGLEPKESFEKEQGARPVFLYSGTLAARYGIVDLLEAFAQLDNADSRLWICGDGDARAEVEAMASRDPRLTYFGQVPRDQALSLQRQADVLVNPRRPQGEYTKYSFPSKTMEYLASGRPVVMHALPGVPVEYLDHLVLPGTPDADGLAAALRQIAAAPAEALKARGVKGRQFILEDKSPKAQVSRLADLWQRQAAQKSRST